MKKIISLFMVMVIMFSIFSLIPTFEQKVQAASYGDFIYTDTGNSIIITRYRGIGGDVAIPSIINDKPVTSIGSAAFLNCTSLTSISIPSGVASICGSTFSGCIGLESITIPSSVTSIGTLAFENCSNLTINTFLGSYAERYAIQNSIPIIYLVATPTPIPTPVPFGIWTVKTLDATNITSSSAVITSSASLINPDPHMVYCNSLDLYYWEAYNPNNKICVNSLSIFGSASNVEVTLTGLKANTSYKYQASLSDNIFGEIKSFSTLIATPTPTPTPVPVPTIPSEIITIDPPSFPNPYGKVGATIVRIDVTGIINPTVDNCVVMAKGVEARYTYYNGVYKFVALVDSSVASSDITVASGTPTRLIYGDVNLNGTIEATDINNQKGKVTGNRTVLNYFELLASDVNGDGLINASDYNTLKGFMAGNLVALPVYSK